MPLFRALEGAGRAPLGGFRMSRCDSTGVKGPEGPCAGPLGRGRESMGRTGFGAGGPKRALFALGSGVLLYLGLTQETWAWGPGVHTVLGLGLLDQVWQMAAGIGAVLRPFPHAFLYGALSADLFVGRSKRKTPGHPHHWKGGFQILQTASSDRERAYAWGFLAHLAADVVAHHLYLPRMLALHGDRTGTGHLYWELRADTLVDPTSVRVAWTVLGMDHGPCDTLLHQVAGGGAGGLEKRKRLLGRSLKMRSLMSTTRDLIFHAPPPMERLPEAPYLKTMLELSHHLALELLVGPEDASCLRADPNGNMESPADKLQRFFHGAMERVRTGMVHRGG